MKASIFPLLILSCALTGRAAESVVGSFAPTVEKSPKPPGPAPEDMVWIPGGEFSMGTQKRVHRGGSYGTFEVPSFEGFVSGPPVAYKVLVSKRNNTFAFNAGEVVHELITPEGAVYTMFSLSLKADPKNTIENLPTLGDRLTLPSGWKYRTRTLDKDLTLTSSYDANPPNTIVLDQFEGNYQHNPDAKKSPECFVP